jgi:arsenate reductase (thioredoxin)
MFNVLFLCTGNSARSIMAEVAMNHPTIGGGKFRAFSAGSHPKGDVHPLALELLRDSRLPIDGLRSKSCMEFARPGAPELDFVFTVCDQGGTGGLSGLARPAYDCALGSARSCSSRGQ